MHIVDKLNLQLDSLEEKIQHLNNEKQILLEDIRKLNDQNDILKRNNENMLLNIDRALYFSNVQNISNTTNQEAIDDISY